MMQEINYEEAFSVKFDIEMANACWPYFDPEYENLSTRINPPRFGSGLLFFHYVFGCFSHPLNLSIAEFSTILGDTLVILYAAHNIDAIFVGFLWTTLVAAIVP